MTRPTKAESPVAGAKWPAKTLNHIRIAIYKPVYEDLYHAALAAGVSLQEEIRSRISPKPAFQIPAKTATGTVLAPCPFCSRSLRIRGGVNSYGQCMTTDCWMEARRIAVPLQDPEQVRAWNSRMKAEKAK